jgi:hypothetical protein
MLQITEAEFGPIILCQQCSVIITHFISSKFFDFSNVSASENSIFTGYPVFDRFYFYYALASLSLFCAVPFLSKSNTKP